MLASAAAGSVLEMSDDVHRSGRLYFSILGVAFDQAAIRCLATVSALVPMAQIKPNSSRATAVVIFLLSLPAAASLMYRLCNRCCAFHAISLISSEILSCRLRNPYQIHGGR